MALATPSSPTTMLISPPLCINSCENAWMCLFFMYVPGSCAFSAIYAAAATADAIPVFASGQQLPGDIPSRLAFDVFR